MVATPCSFADLPQTGVYSVYGLCERYVIVTTHVCACVTFLRLVYAVCIHCERDVGFLGTTDVCSCVCVCLCVGEITHCCFAYIPQTDVCSVCVLCAVLRCM